MGSSILQLLILLLLTTPAAFAAAEKPPVDPVIQELQGIQENDQKERERLTALDETLPELNPDKATEFAGKLGMSFKVSFTKIKEAKTKKERNAWIKSAELLLETVALVSSKIDAGDNAEARIKAYEKMIERRRLPLKVLTFVAGAINTLAGVARGGGPLNGIDIYDSAQDSMLEPFEISSERWPYILAEDFILAFKEKAGIAVAASLQLEPGLEGAMRVRRTFKNYLKLNRCEAALLP